MWISDGRQLDWLSLKTLLPGLESRTWCPIFDGLGLGIGLGWAV